jgi:hypothetical protein
VAWGVASAKEGRYTGEQSYLSGLHESVLVDYEIEDVPGHGTLPLGVPVTDEAILEAALAPEARITQFRLKNSWGQDPFYSEEEWRQFGAYGERPTTAKESYLPAKPGYNDVDMAYFDSAAEGVSSWYGASSHFMLAVALPNQQRFPVPQKALKRAFVSFERYRANDFEVLGGPDAICSGLAKKAGLGNSYGALLSAEGVDPAAGFDVAHTSYRALSFRRGTQRAKPIEFGAYPGVTQDGVPTEAAFWSGGGAATTCTDTGIARDAQGVETEVPCGEQRALVCFEK